MVGGSSCFHSLCGLFVIPRNKVVPAGLRVGQAVRSGLNNASPPHPLPLPVSTWQSKLGMPLYAQAPRVAVLSSQSPQQRPGFSLREVIGCRRSFKSCYIAQAGFQLSILVPKPPECWAYARLSDLPKHNCFRLNIWPVQGWSVFSANLGSPYLNQILHRHGKQSCFQSLWVMDECSLLMRASVSLGGCDRVSSGYCDSDRLACGCPQIGALPTLTHVS